jgi:ferrous iron transport protein B
VTTLATQPDIARRTLRLAVAGNPNSGKTTLFNRLTGLRHKVGNYPGVTVEHKEGRLTGQAGITLIDLPGTYSLAARSVDERVARDVLLGWMAAAEPVDGVIIVVDASNLERNLYLATQILDLNLPAIVVCNMMDVAEASGQRIDTAALARALGVPVVPTVARSGWGVAELRRQIAHLDEVITRKRAWRASAALERLVADLTRGLADSQQVPLEQSEGAALLLLTQEGREGARDERGLPLEVVDALGPILRQARSQGVPDPVGELVAARYAWLGALTSQVVQRQARPGATLSDRIDRVATHKLAGPVLFAGIMLVMFLSIFSWAQPLMEGIEGVIKWLGTKTAATLGPGMLTDLLVGGVLKGVGAVVVFFPQICLLFLFIALLEDSGYMARAAFIMDRIMNRVGLHGRSFIPLLSSYACAVPGIMATRTIENRRDRLTTILVAPLMSCSARLPVYLIVISAVFGANVWLKTGVMFGLYTLGTVTALLMATLFKKTLLKGPTPVFIMELPPYRLPRLTTMIRHTWDRAKLFLTRAGTIILAISIVLWGLAYFPRVQTEGSGFRVQDVASPPATADLRLVGGAASPAPGTRPDATDSGLQLRQSYLGRAGRLIEPVIRPLGFDWKIGIGVIASFAAREVFVSTMGVVYGVEDKADETSVPLRAQMIAQTWPDGRKVYTPLAGMSLMVFYVLACQCMSTLAVVRRETQSWRWPVFMFGYMTALAYTGSLLVYQVGSALGGGT